jgi:hypothetical protein
MDKERLRESEKRKRAERQRQRSVRGAHTHAYNGAETTVQPRMHFIGPMPFIVRRTAGGSKETAAMRNPVQLNAYCLHIFESIRH